MKRLIALLLASAGACATPGTTSDVSQDRVKAIHDRVMTLDTHVDIDPNNFQAGVLNYANRLNTQVDLTKMEEGGLDAVFFSIYVGQGPLDAEGYARAYTRDTTLFNAVHRLATQLAPTRIGIAYTADDARRIYASGKKVAFMGVENAYGLGTDIKRVKEFYDRGARYMSLSHNGHSQLSDSNTGEASNQWMWNGLSPFGRQVIAEMNRLGIMIDISHPSKQSNMQAIAMSRAPVIASHSGVRAICNHSRNLDDEELRAVAKNGGVVQMVAFRTYVKCDAPRVAARTQALDALYREFGITLPTGPTVVGGGRGAGGAPRGAVAGTAGPACSASPVGGRAGMVAAAVDSQLNLMAPARRTQYAERVRAVDAQYPAIGAVTVKDFVDHIDYGVKLMGLDHVGISSDFDGGGGVDGWNCALESINVTAELVRRGYTEEQIGKLWSGNLLRVLSDVEGVAKQLQGARS